MSGTCAYCGDPFTDAPGKRQTKDHIIPKELGGFMRGHANIVQACRECNSLKGAMTIAAMMELADATDRHAARLRRIAAVVEELMIMRGLSL